jgi:tRNA-2-methylthio-N6-dimethylallyladenosine synthase
VGRVLPVLLERAGRHHGQMVGRTPYLQPVHLLAPGVRPGMLIDVAIEDSQPHSLAGAPLAAHGAKPQLREAFA